MRSTNKTQPSRKQASVFSGESSQGSAAGLESYKDPRASRTQEEAKSTPPHPRRAGGGWRRPAHCLSWKLSALCTVKHCLYALRTTHVNISDKPQKERGCAG